ncbi:MAG: nuclear transport factor 2 family protein [Solirubrobacteraceae bacterium]|jgi:ketosteroid isomerase-like protein
MYAWLVGLLVRRGFRKLNAGDASGALDLFASDAHFVFPGRHSFGADLTDPEQIRAWFERFVALGPHFEIADVIASGPPWNMRVGVRFSDRIALADGGEYRNEGMQYVRLGWGRVRLDRIFLDTQAVADADPLLIAKG